MNQRRFLIYRADRVGDVVLTLPVVGLIRNTFPGAEITFFLRSYTRELVAEYPGVSGVILADRNGRVRPFDDLLLDVRQGGFDAAVHVFPRPAQAWLSYRAKIPVRVGTAFRWYSWLYNRWVWDHRKTGDLHEAVYNIRLLRKLGVSVPDSVRPSLHVPAAYRQAALNTARRLGILENDRVVALHPGSGGSARDWDPSQFSQLSRELSAKGFRPVITGAQEERQLVEQVVAGSNGSAVAAAGAFSLMELAAFLQSCSVVVSNSTGPMHIAAAVGTPLVGLFPPIAAASARRWGPLGDRTMTFTPDAAKCPLCKGGDCQSNVCMRQITVTEVLGAVETLTSR